MDTPKFGVLILFESQAEAERKSIALAEIFPGQSVRLVPWYLAGEVGYSKFSTQIPELIRNWPISASARLRLMYAVYDYHIKHFGQWAGEQPQPIHQESVTREQFFAIPSKQLPKKRFYPRYRREVQDYLQSVGVGVDF